jgi:hypothetical protein
MKLTKRSVESAPVGSYAHRAGASQREVADLLGHKQMSTAARYIHGPGSEKHSNAARASAAILSAVQKKDEKRCCTYATRDLLLLPSTPTNHPTLMQYIVISSLLLIFALRDFGLTTLGAFIVWASVWGALFTLYAAAGFIMAAF